METSIYANEIGELVRNQEQDWVNGTIQTSKYVSEEFYEDINKIEAYLNSKHTSGEKDSLGRDKPFFNIVLAARNIWFRATDLDRKHILAKADKTKDLLASYLFTIHLQKWMDEANFGRFLNDWGLYLSSYNSAICKFVENSKGLTPLVMDWNKMIVDVIDFDNNPKIEILELTPAQLKKRDQYDQEMVDKLIDAVSTRQTQDGQQRDQKANYIKLYEVHGELPLSYITGKEKDQETFVQQMHIVSFVASKEKGKFDDYCLYSGREKQDPYMLTYLIGSVDGSISLMGSVKALFEAQWMANHSVKAIKDQLDLSSKIIFQTADPNYANQNMLKNIESGKIMVYNAEKSPNGITHVANNANDITALQNFGQQWKNLAQEIVSTPDVLSGENFPSGTAWRQAGIVQQEAHSNFEIMTENKGLFIEQMCRKYITPYLLRRMDTTEEITATLDAYGIDKIDQRYISNEAIKRFNRKAVEAVLNETELPNLQKETQGVKDELNQLGGQRFIKPSEISTKTWKDVIGDFEGDVVYEITGENRDKQAVMTTLSTVFQTLAMNPMVLQDPNTRLVFNKILEETRAISPIEIQEVQAQPQAPIPQPAQQQPVTPQVSQMSNQTEQPMVQ